MAKKVNPPTTEPASEETLRITLHSTFQGILRHGGKKYRAGDTLAVGVVEFEKYGYSRFADIEKGVEPELT